MKLGNLLTGIFCLTLGVLPGAFAVICFNHGNVGVSIFFGAITLWTLSRAHYYLFEVTPANKKAQEMWDKIDAERLERENRAIQREAERKAEYDREIDEMSFEELSTKMIEILRNAS